MLRAVVLGYDICVRVMLLASASGSVGNWLALWGLIACAGSGRTEVVARRVVHLLTPGRPDLLAPRNIVAFTFTDKAAAELKERIVTRTRETPVEAFGPGPVAGEPSWVLVGEKGLDGGGKGS